MADNDQNDEYKFEELDSLENESLDTSEFDTKSSAPARSVGMDPQKNVKRNALIAVGVIVFAMLMYKFIGGMFSKSTPPKESITPAPVAELTPTPPQPVTQIPPEPVQPKPVVQQQPPVVQVNNAALEQKVASIEASQQSVQSEVSSMNQQVGNVNNNVNALNAQITKLNQMISDLNNQVVKQSEVINVLIERTKPKPVKKIIRPRPLAPQIIYYINAVIPGRAWLIGTNGSTLTVREGTKIAGYGTVKLIDSMQGRVLTSSGRVIRFSQEDS
ncbi:type IVB secretion system protein IcmG/DotF [Fluoribacter gormanii]|uniref:Intracellular multiplication protein IcmG n=1 Tax=Fluoribacter gormanii TaxID=464 RepID=A0A377GMV9_9GAMM|nr:type IVB secretion system protein IcmG/DotF [Fluoribacter gormanii]KTD05650.1 Component of the Dot/Icm secretion system [Fluoribacter gormanii]MCW8442566.1 type IVB secretion system protein IcmG/DotF [Fluoribacter gormanii]MCW8471056.1 type IVB secretion system protein IcmG/DotF [Fluoribacter gormanii]SIQ65597.1 intracellular multiplication protein IcmG [Fluoribacter gormanii]STO25825.1 Membrane-bound metallopeptidase [Fluoribacter gormanii]